MLLGLIQNWRIREDTWAQRIQSQALSQILCVWQIDILQWCKIAMIIIEDVV